MAADDNFEQQKLTKEEKTKKKYEEHTNSYKARDHGLEEGVVRERGIKDILCVILFFAFVIAMIVCAVYGGIHG